MPCGYAACAQTSALATVTASRIENFIYIKRHHQKVERIAVITAHDCNTDASRQWDINIGTVIDFNISRVTPPRMISRNLECP